MHLSRVQTENVRRDKKNNSILSAKAYLKNFQI